MSIFIIYLKITVLVHFNMERAAINEIQREKLPLYENSNASEVSGRAVNISHWRMMP